MKCLTSNFVVLLYILMASPLSLAGDTSLDNCDATDGLPSLTEELIQTLGEVSDGLFQDVFEIKVNLDGEGKLSIYFENGIPVILKLSYKNQTGTSIQQITFDELEQGKTLAYENPSIPGKAIVVKKSDDFQSGNIYKFNLSYRTSVRPVEFETHPLEFTANTDTPRISTSGRSFNRMTLSPGTSFFRWDGTFKRVEFK